MSEEVAATIVNSSGIGLGNPVLDQLAVSVLNEKWLGYLKKGLAAYAIGMFAYKTQRSVRGWVADRSTFSLVVDEQDPVFDELVEWLVLSQPARRHRILEARTSKVRNGGAEIAEVGSKPQRRRAVVQLLFEGESAMTTTVKGHRVTFSIDKPNHTVTSKESKFKMRDKMRIQTRSEEGRDAVVDLLADFTAKRNAERTQPDVFIMNSWGDWSRRNDVPRRELETVVLAEGQVDDLVNDLTGFLDTEAAYNKLGQPWHRGYLFFGPPGTGKTSLAKAIATYFDMDIYCIALADVKDDSNLASLMTSVPPRSILLLEDIDVFHASTSSEEKDSGLGLTLSGLLNSLDGLATPHGMVTIMTSNHPEKLKSELTRRGRIDKEICIDYITYEQITRMFAIFYDGYALSHINAKNFDGLGKLVPAQITEAIKCNLDNPARAEIDILALEGVSPNPSDTVDA